MAKAFAGKAAGKSAKLISDQECPGILEGLIVQTEIEVFHFDGPVPVQDLALDTPANGVAPIEIAPSCIEIDRINVEAGRVIRADRAARRVNQPVIERDTDASAKGGIKITVGRRMRVGVVEPDGRRINSPAIEIQL